MPTAVVDDSWAGSPYRESLVRALLRLLRSRGPEPGLLGLDAAEELPPGTVRLLLTDGLSPRWRDGTALELLRRWGRSGPTAAVLLSADAVPLVPGPATARTRLRAPGPGAANLHWRLEQLPDEEPLQVGAGPVVPLLHAEPRWFAAWDRLLSGGRTVQLTVCRPATDGPPRQPGPVPVRDAVRAFAATASPTAFALGVLLAAVPVTPAITAQLCRLVPGSAPLDVMPLLAHGLLVPAETRPDAEAGALDFRPGARAALLGYGRRTDAQLAWRAVDAVCSPDRPLFAPVLDRPERAGRPEGPAPHLRVLAEVLAVLDGPRAEPPPHALPAPDGEQPTRHPAGPVDTPPSTARRPAAGGGSMTTSTGTAPAIWGNIPPRNRNFTGRAELLSTLHERLADGATAVLPEAMHGLGGIGKSQLAVEYLYRHQGEYDLVWWIPSERTPQITQSLAELGRRLGITEAEPGATVGAVLDALRTGQPYQRWLLVFDNAESPEQIAPFLPTTGTGSVLITSRYPHWEHVARQLEVTVFTRDESKELLRRRGQDLSDEDADRLAEALGDLPLAIEQAAAWRAETGMSADEYLRLFEEKKSELLQFSAPFDYQKSAATAWNVSLDHVERINPAAIQLLQVCAFFAPEPIPRGLLTGPKRAGITPELDRALADEMRLSLAIREISRYSLARIDPRTKAVQMHRLVQAALVNRMTESQQARMRQGAHMLLSAADPRNPESPSSWERYAELYPHVAASQAIRSADPWVRELVLNVAKYLQRWGDHSTALEFTTEAYQVWKAEFGEDEQHTLRMAWWLGFVLTANGRYAEAAELNNRTLRHYEKQTPGDPGALRPSQIREERLDAMSAVAADLRVKGDFDAALEMSRTVHELSLRAFDEEDPVTLNAAHNLGVSLRLVGRFQDAYELDRRTWAQKAELFGTHHEQTLLTRNGLSIDQRELGRYEHARNRQEEVVALHEQLLGISNQATLHARRVLAVARRKAGDHQGARELSERTLELMRRRFGDEHPDTMASALALSVDLRHTGELEAAASLAKETAARFAETLGAEHPHTRSAFANLAITLRLAGDAEGALQQDEAAFAGLSERLGRNHVLALVVETNLASDLAALGRHEEALARGLDVVARSSEILGPEHPSTLAARANVALDLRAVGREDEALADHAATVEAMRRVLGPTHPATADFAAWTRANCYIDPLPL
ncbi:FxSxx-COOH system tetratricopeptide repeat protein [Streptacidiphilus monticola]|uniref:FxSxx-COOH system tetratricopeptide repeat protein n=1 Tax=Streptacidiphilus monticola TaxID=2161674 RepID=A0ABW1G1F9_9ACTN